MSEQLRYVMHVRTGDNNDNDIHDVVDTQTRHPHRALLCRAPRWAAKEIVDALNKKVLTAETGTA